MNRYDKELKVLKRENQRLRKMLNRAEETVSEFYDLPIDFEGEIEIEEKKERLDKRSKRAAKKRAVLEAKGLACPDCGSKTEELPIGPFIFQFCEEKCGFRKKLRVS